MESIWHIDNLIVNSQVKKYKSEHPDENILFAGGTKAISRAFEKEVKAGADFFNAKRTVFVLTDKYISAGEWRIQIDNITRAELDTYNSLYGKAMFLKLKTKDGGNYQFGMRYDEDFFKQNTLRFVHKEIENVIPVWLKLTHYFKPVLLLLLIGYIICWLVRKFG